MAAPVTIDVDAGRARIAAAMPASVRAICAELSAAGHQAVAVGGAVRDALLGRPAGDWDVATSASPDRVVALFRRTIPTGLAHGTVTVLWGKGGVPVEVTTFRGEGAYSDARRPDQVVFGVPLVEDLARRDFVVNAIAFDPAAGALIDPFDGVGDLRAGVLRAVGEPALRFGEDGLRIMRAVRFVATLELALATATEAAIAGALPSLARVSAERVCVELGKLLGARQPSRGLAVADRTGITALILPELSAAAEARGRRVDAAERGVRLAALLAELAPGPAEAVLRRLKFSGDERDGVVRLLGAAVGPHLSDGGPDRVATRRLLAAVGRAHAARLRALWQARLAEPPEPAVAAGLGQAITHLDAIVGAGDALAVADLAVRGADLIAELGLTPGPAIGRILATLLDEVLTDPAGNTRPGLLARARVLLPPA